MVAHTDYHVEGSSQVYGHNHCNNSNNSCDNEHHDDVSVYVTPPKRRRISMESRVRFDEKIIYIEDHTHDERRSPTPVTESSEHSSPTSLWLTPNDFTKIQNNVFTTLEMMKLTGDFGRDTPLSNRYCARGLEGFDPERKGSLKMDTLQRRRNVIGAVLHEQNLQQQRIRQERQSRPQQQHNVHGGRNYSSTSPTSEHDNDDYHRAPNHMSDRQTSYPGGTATSMSRTSCGLDHFRISLICMNLTYHDTMQGIEYGRQDSEDALEIYRTKPLPVDTNIVQSP